MGTQVCEGCWGWSTEGHERRARAEHPLGCSQTGTPVVKTLKPQESEAAPDPRHLPALAPSLGWCLGAGLGARPWALACQLNRGSF